MSKFKQVPLKVLSLMALAVLLSTSLIACGGGGGKSGNIVAAGPRFTIDFKDTIRSCETGKKEFTSLADYCDSLLDDAGNGHCARDLRLKAYQDNNCSSLTDDGIVDPSIGLRAEAWYGIWTMIVGLNSGDSLKLAPEPQRAIPWSDSGKPRTLVFAGLVEVNGRIEEFCRSPEISISSKDSFCATIKNDRAMNGCSGPQREWTAQTYQCGSFTASDRIFSHQIDGTDHQYGSIEDFCEGVMDLYWETSSDREADIALEVLNLYRCEDYGF